MCLYPVTIENPRYKQFGIPPKNITVSCGKCSECQRARSEEWALRIMLEAKEHAENCFITLTYDNEHLPENGLLCRRDIQLFLKSLRKAVSPKKIRVFYSGEYGSQRGRPHFHLIVFGWTPPDLVPFTDNKGERFSKSAMVAKLWKRGYISVGDLTPESALYCAKYMQKYAAPDKDIRPFIGMSNRPGIAHDYVNGSLLGGVMYYRGKQKPIPRYFVKVLEQQGKDVSDIKALRHAFAVMNSRCKYTPEDEYAKRKKEKEYYKKP